MHDPKIIIDLLANNVRRTRSPFGIPKALVNGWTKGLKLGRDGEAMLFTGLMYQFTPFIETATKQLERFEDTKWTKWLPYAKYAPSSLSGLGLAAMTTAHEKRKTAEHLRNIVKVLRKSGVDFGYRPELDEYSGILLYDLGDQENFVRHARFVAGKLQKAGVTKLITTDPHTTYALKKLYPKHIGAVFEVKTYFELADLPAGAAAEKLTLHDPCFYGRYLELSDAPRKALQGLGYECVDAQESGLFTVCCGGPAESISPKLSSELATRRMEKLDALGGKVVAMCPICLNNLQKTGADVVDLSTILARSA